VTTEQKPEAPRKTRSSRPLTAEIRKLLVGQWVTQHALSLSLNVSQRTINSRLQQMTRAHELKRKNVGKYEGVMYRMRGT
jgi:hypothetical protein